MINEYVIKNMVGFSKTIQELETYAETHAIPDAGLVLTLDHYQPDRNNPQNKLMWARHGEVAKQWGDHNVNYIHAMSKREVLMPFMLSLDRHHKATSWAKEVIDMQPNESRSLFTANRMLSTSDLSKSEFSDYMNMYQLYWSLNADIVFSQ
jgi:hypothetical protein